ncbi:MAG: glutamine-hydrolyzing carbamoyl-phosphate synthase small subunit [Candidatus Micrarchaeota archaeon]|nr:glutamine-hydrolyzing carbamoyl-phosphate synthase small subunit [Candidatus Micrarchaeota archaeon]
MYGILVLDDGSVYFGKGFGAETEKVGELVFTTSMVGYQESLTDPSYAGQILISTYPMIGNYGIAKDFNEGKKVYVEGYVIRDLSHYYYHRKSSMSLDEFLKQYNVPGIYEIDTRSLVTKIRERGVMKAFLKTSKDSLNEIDYKLFYNRITMFNYEEIDYVKEVSIKEIKYIGNGSKMVLVVDCGAKSGIVNELLQRNCQVILAPCNITSTEIKDINPDGVFYTNGPGNPAELKYIYEQIPVIAKDYPIFGICLGNQLIGHAFGGKTFKLKFGHRGVNQACLDLFSNRVYVTTHNHGYAVEKTTLPKELEVWMINLNDKTIEGLKHKELDVASVQFHPEARPGTFDTKWIFDEFVKKL